MGSMSPFYVLPTTKLQTARSRLPYHTKIIRGRQSIGSRERPRPPRRRRSPRAFLRSSPSPVLAR
eukprot:scaffold26193_cov32-Tisochrysis_lutea.AAC.3